MGRPKKLRTWPNGSPVLSQLPEPPPSEDGNIQDELLLTIPEGISSLRDHFAAAALTGMLASGMPYSADKAASNAYAIADAMLAARQQPATPCAK